MSDVFISYARRDRAPIEQLARILQDAGFSVWWDHEIAGGAAFAAEIERQLNAARAVIVAWSINGVQSEWVLDEAGTAKQAGKLVPIALDATMPPMGFRQIHCIDFSTWHEDPEAGVVAELQRSLHRYCPSGLKGTNETGIHDVVQKSAGNTIAVLPLDNFSGDTNQQFFVDGMHEALITELSKVKALQVISRTSTRRYASTDKSLREIGAELGASRLIEGSVVRNGDEVRITVQLIDARTDTHLWAETFDRDIVNILKLQREIARAIVDEVSVILTPDEAARLAVAPQVDPQAYEAYLKGMYHWYRLTPEDSQAALECFNTALARDARHAPAWAGIATAWAGIQQMGAAPTAVAGPRIKEAVEKALALDPDLAQARFALAAYYTWVAWDWAKAEPQFRRAIELNPGFPDSHAYYAHYLSIVGRFDEAEIEINHALNVDPFNPLIRALNTACLFFFRRWDEALAEAQQVLNVAPDHWLAYQAMRFVYVNQGEIEKALDATRALYTTLGNPEVVAAIDAGREEAGTIAAFKRAADTLAQQAQGRFVLPSQIACLYGIAGDVENAVDWIEKAFEIRDPDLPYLRCAWRFPVDVMKHPRVQRVISDFNYPAIPEA